MKPLIDCLGLQAGLYTRLANGHFYPVSMTAEDQQKALTKFADIIVSECVKLAVFRGDSATAQAIKQHFEVEE